jgi:class 3 adenylate cyclase
VQPDVAYARSGDLLIAYQVLGSGIPDVLVAHGWALAFDTGWDQAHIARFYRRLAARSKLILFDARGTGMSDKVPLNDLPDLEARMDDLKVVLDAAGSERAVLFGMGEASHLCLLFAATYPERTAGLVLHAGAAHGSPGLDATDDPLGRQIATVGWRRDLALAYLRDAAPTLMSDQAACDWWVRSIRLTLSPSDNTAYDRMVAATNVRSALSTIRAPALVLCPRGDPEYLPDSQELASALAGARLVEFAGTDHVPWGRDQDIVLDEVDRFLDHLSAPADAGRVLATVLLTDLVGSTELAEKLGDQRWRELLERHHERVREALARHRGREIETTGDGFLAAFDGPARAIRCACAIGEAVGELGLEVRAGLHTGECELLEGGRLGGIAIHIGARIAAEAQAGEVLVSRTVRDLVAGSGIGFDDRGVHELKGIAEPWHLYAVTP